MMPNLRPLARAETMEGNSLPGLTMRLEHFRSLQSAPQRTTMSWAPSAASRSTTACKRGRIFGWDSRVEEPSRSRATIPTSSESDPKAPIFSWVRPSRAPPWITSTGRVKFSCM